MKERGSEGWEIIKKKQTFLDKINQKSLLTSFDVKIFSEWNSALIEQSFEIYIRN